VSTRRGRSGVFINCPFDESYDPIFKAIVFTVAACGFVPRCSLEQDDSGESRLGKIYRLIEGCPQGIHDISRTELDTANQLPRFNMPLELGVMLGAKRYGGSAQKRKRILILDRQEYRYQKFISDIAGQDIKIHGNQSEHAARAVRDWLRNAGHGKDIPGAAHIWRLYQQFNAELPVLCTTANLEAERLVFNDYLQLVVTWLKNNLR
jgi:hypothetical protein